eukprot:Skav214396  [mRNA]  locus=scaffold2495:44983:46731:+ [translate_table: standard]
MSQKIVQQLRNTKGFTAHASALVRKTSWRRAISLLQNIPRLKLRPDSILINTSAAACAAGAHWVGAFETLDWHRRIGSEESEVIPALSAVVTACVKARQWRSAHALLPKLQSVQHVQLRPQSLATVAHAYGQMHWWQLALCLLPAGRTGPRQDGSVLVSVLGALARSAQWKHAITTLFANLAIERSAKAVSAATFACAEASRWEQALAVLFRSHQIRLVPHQLDRINYNSALTACARGSRWHQALQLLRFMKRNGTGDIQPDVVSFSIAITACEKGSSTLEAMDLLRQMKDISVSLDAVAFSAAIGACEKSSRWSDALRILAQAVQEEKADSVSFSAAMSACEKGSCWDLALDVLSQMQRSYQPGLIHYGSLLASCSLAAAWSQAMGLLEDARLDAASWMHALTSYEAAGHWPGVSPVLQGIRRQLALQMAFAHRGDPSAARAYAASTGSLEVCQGYDIRFLYSKLDLILLRARVRAPALEELRDLRRSSSTETCTLEALCDLGRPCTQDTLEQLHFSVPDVDSVASASASMASLLSESGSRPLNALPLQATATKLGAWTNVQFGPGLRSLNGVERTLGTHR